MKVSTLCALALGALLSAAGAARGQANAPVNCLVGDAKVLEWNAIAVDTIGTTPPVPAARFLAVTQLAVFEAVNAITAEYEPYLGTLTAPLREPRRRQQPSWPHTPCSMSFFQPPPSDSISS